jgi:YD repeat-containing protein
MCFRDVHQQINFYCVQFYYQINNSKLVKNAFCFLFALLLSYISVLAQTKLNVIAPSPEASALGKYGDIPVSAYTGVPQIGIPIYTIKSGDIQVPVSLSYHASGIRVDEEASWVGLGWTLQANGVITHTVRGKDDLVQNFYFNTAVPEFVTPNQVPGIHVRGTDMPGVNGAIVPLFDFVKRSADVGSYYCDADHATDFEPDQFSFNFMGYSGKFSFRRNKTILIAAQEKIDIKPFWNGNDITKWEVRTKDGTKYVFDQIEFYKEPDCPSVNSKTGWYLSRVISATGAMVTFNYSISSATMTQPIGTVFESQTYSTDGRCSAGPPVQKLNQAFRRYTTVTLKNIQFDNGQVNFGVDSSRVDLQNSKRLNTISVFRKNTSGILESIPFKQFNLTYDYFHGTPGTTKLPYGGETSFFLKRLKLVSVQETHGGTVVPPYTIHYYEGENYNLPSKGSFARDHWGYYNGATDNTTLLPAYTGPIYTLNVGTVNYDNNYLAKDGKKLSDQEAAEAYKEKIVFGTFSGANREPSSQNMVAFSVKDIVYPTGGKSEFKFEPHDYDEESSNVNTMSSKINLPDLRAVSKTCTQNSWNELNQVKNQTIDLRNIYVPKGQTAGEITFKFNFISTNGMNALQTLPAGLAYIDFSSTHIDVHEAQTAKCPTSGYYSCNCFVDDPAIPGTELKTNCEFSQTFLVTPGLYTFSSFIATQAKDYITYINATFSWNEGVSSSANPISLAGGLRLREIIDYDIDGSVISNRKMNYHYQTDRNGDGIMETRSFGRRMSKPLYLSYEVDNYWVGKDGCAQCASFVLECYKFMRTNDSVIPNNGSASGCVVGYDQVAILYEKDTNGNYGVGGKTIFEFENNPDVVFDYGLMRKPGIPNLASNRNGLQKKVTEYKYKYGVYQKIRQTKNSYANTTNRTTLYGIQRFPFTLTGSGGLLVPGGLAGDKDVDLYLYPALPSEWIQLASTTVTEFDENDTLKTFSKVTNFFYDNPNHLQLTRQSMTDSKGNVYQTRMKYPLDYPSGSLIDSLTSRFIVDPVIEKIETIDGKIIAATGQKYFVNPVNTNQLLLKDINILETSIPLTNFTGSTDGKTFTPYRKRATYDRYDANGNVLQFTKDKAPIAVVWGYNNTRPVAQIENATYAEVVAVLGSALTTIPTLDGGPLRSALTPLRTGLPKARVTIMTYDPLVGMTSQVDPNGNISYFEYDEIGRLIRVKDYQNKLLKSFVYKYYNEQ